MFVRMHAHPPAYRLSNHGGVHHEVNSNRCMLRGALLLAEGAVAGILSGWIHPWIHDLGGVTGCTLLVTPPWGNGDPLLHIAQGVAPTLVAKDAGCVGCDV